MLVQEALSFISRRVEEGLLVVSTQTARFLVLGYNQAILLGPCRLIQKVGGAEKKKKRIILKNLVLLRNIYSSSVHHTGLISIMFSSHTTFSYLRTSLTTLFSEDNISLGPYVLWL